MNFLKSIYNDFKQGSSSEKLGIISDILQVITVLFAVIFSPQILSLVYGFDINTYFNIVLTIAFSISLVLFFLGGSIIVLEEVKKRLANSSISYKLLYVSFVILWVGAILSLTPLIIATFSYYAR